MGQSKNLYWFLRTISISIFLSFLSLAPFRLFPGCCRYKAHTRKFLQGLLPLFLWCSVRFSVSAVRSCRTHRCYLCDLWIIASFWIQFSFHQGCHLQAAHKPIRLLAVSCSTKWGEASFHSVVFCSVMRDSTGGGKCPSDRSAEITLWHPFSGALPVLWRLLPAPHPHCTLPGQRKLGATQDHLHKVWV